MIKPKISYEDLQRKISNQLRKNRDEAIREKIHLFLLALKLENVTEACARRNISRDFFYRWWKRFSESEFKLEALIEQSHRPHFSPHKISQKIELRILTLRNQYREGAEMIFYRLRREGVRVSESTIEHVLRKRRQNLPRRTPKLKTHQKRYELPIPGQRVQIDLKYAGTLNTGQKVYVFNAIDECTRFRFAKAFLNFWSETTLEFLNLLTQNFPFPIQCIQTDHGREFKNQRVQSWCRKNKIWHRFIPPGEKELNGKIERSHRLDEDYFYWRAERKTIDGSNIGLGRWIQEYNFERPHGGLHGLTPHEKWQERLKNLPAEKIDEKWALAFKRFHHEYELLKNPNLKLLLELQTELTLYNHPIGKY